MIQKGSLLKLNGFYKTLEILSIQGRAMSLKTFYEKLFKNQSYYNAYYRVKDTMITKKIIEIYYEKTDYTKRIRLTKKGKTIKQTISAIVELIG